jgi:hypothetical protein
LLTEICPVAAYLSITDMQTTLAELRAMLAAEWTDRGRDPAPGTLRRGYRSGTDAAKSRGEDTSRLGFADLPDPAEAGRRSLDRVYSHPDDLDELVAYLKCRLTGGRLFNK